MMKSPKKSTKGLKIILTGILILSITLSMFTFAPVTKAEDEPLFSITLMAPTSNPVRRQHAALLGNAMQSVGIDAKVVYVTFSDLISRLFPDKEDLGKLFDEGGYDIGFVGFGYTSPVPDVRSLYLGTEDAFPPGGNNFATWNNSEANELLTKIYTTSDTTLQDEYFQEFTRLVDKENPYITIFYSVDVHARDPNLMVHGDPDAFSTMSFPFDSIQYMSGIDTLVFAEVGDWSSLAPWENSDSNSFYALFIYGPTRGYKQLVDPRTDTFFLNEAESITANEDGTVWTVKIREGIKFHSGVEETVDDFIFAKWAQMQPEVASVELSDIVEQIGNVISFTYLNGTTITVDVSGGAEPRYGSLEAIDRYTGRMTIASPPYPFLNLTQMTGSSLPKHYLEQIPLSEWNQLTYATGIGDPYTFTWDTAKYGGSGTYTAYGPFGTGPYVYMGYDATKRLASLKKFEDYWNKDALEAQGYFTVEDYHVVTIVEKDAAIAAFRTGDVNALDVNYQMATEVELLESLGANVVLKPQIGWQCFSFNMMHPIVGTGVDTPLGREDPSRAAEAARHVRQAISYLVPRDLIIEQLMDGLAFPGTTFLKPFGKEDPNITPDPYDITLAKAELAAAGYETGVNPITPEPPAPEFAENILYGTAIPYKGKIVNPITDVPIANMVGYVEESSDGETWTDVAFSEFLTDENGEFEVQVTPANMGDNYFRTYFTGLTAPLPAFDPLGLITGVDTIYYDQLVEDGTLPVVMPAQTSEPIKVTTKEMGDILTDALENTATKDDTSAISSEITALTSEVADLKKAVSSANSMTYGAIGIAIIAIAIAAFSFMRKS
jgi:ABC-type transport system substrate-binding protein